MCGRYACPLAPDDLCCASSYKKKHTDLYVKPVCIFHIKSYNPSYNIPPTSFAPIIVSAEHGIQKSKIESERIIIPMHFGVVPYWLAPGEFKPGKLETHLCKVETMSTSKLYKHILGNGGRCVVPCSGYYEWQSTKGSYRQPYFFYNQENSAENLISVKGGWDENIGWQGMKLLYLAGLFNMYINAEGEKLYSFAIITQDASEEWKWIHHRMPVVLQSEEDINNWIHVKSVSLECALKSLKTPIKNMKSHPVDKAKINNAKNNMPKCVEEIHLNKPINKLMQAWMNSTHDEVGSVEKRTVTYRSSSSNVRSKKTKRGSSKILEDFVLRPSKKPKTNT